MHWKRGGLLVAGIVAGAVAGTGCDTDQKKAKGPNPYRREYRVAQSNARTDLAATGLDRLAAAGTTSGPTSAPTSAPAGPPMPGPVLPPGTVGSPVMFVNSDTISIEDVLMPIREELEKAAAALPPQQYMNKAALLVRREIERELYVAVVYREASKGLAKEEEEQYLKAADAEIQQMVNLKFGGLHAKFEKYLAERSMTVADLREKTKRRFLVHKFLADRFKPLAEHPKRTDLKKYYDEHLADFTTKPRAKMSLIEVSFEGSLRKPRGSATAAELAAAKEAARSKIARAKQELDSGVAFAAVAKAYSDGPHSDDGGAWDEIGPDSLRARYRAAADRLFQMQPGEVSDVLEGSDAFFIVRCDGATPGRRMTFEEAQPQIAERMLEQRYQEMQDRYVQDLMKKAIVQKDVEFFQAVMAAIPRPRDRADTAGGSDPLRTTR